MRWRQLPRKGPADIGALHVSAFPESDWGASGPPEHPPVHSAVLETPVLLSWWDDSAGI
jgi:hypothetical protein